MPNVTKKDLIDTIVARTNEKRVVVKQVLQMFLDGVVEELGRGNRIELRDFGVFEVKWRAERIAQNPKTLEKVIVPAKASVKFKPGRLMKERVDNANLAPSTQSSKSTDQSGTPSPVVTDAGRHHASPRTGRATHADGIHTTPSANQNRKSTGIPHARINSNSIDANNESDEDN